MACLRNLTQAKFPRLRVFAFRLIAFLALADIGTDIAYLLGDHKTNTIGCTLQGVMRIYFNDVAILLTTVSVCGTRSPIIRT